MTKFIPIILVMAAFGIALLIVGCRTQQQTNTTPTATSTTPAAGTVTIGADEASCPVLGTVMKKANMIPVQHNGKTYYLCCRGCVGQFKANPEKYITHPAPPTREMKMN